MSCFVFTNGSARTDLFGVSVNVFNLLHFDKGWFCIMVVDIF